MLRRFLSSKRASVSTLSDTSASVGNDGRFEDISIKTEESERERLFVQSNEDDDVSVIGEELSFIVDYLGSDQISEAQSVPLLMETLKRVKKQHSRTIRVDFVIRDGILKVSNVLQGALLITAPLYAVALCAQEQLRGFDSTFAINITRKRLHMCHVFQAGSRLEASSIVKSVAVSFKSVGRLLKDRRERSRTGESTSLHSSERLRSDSTDSQWRERTRTDSEGSRERGRVEGDHLSARKRHQSGTRGGKTTAGHLPTLPSEESLETNGSGTGSTNQRHVIYVQVHNTLPRDASGSKHQGQNIDNAISATNDLQDVVDVFSRESMIDFDQSVPPSDEDLSKREYTDSEDRGDLSRFNEAVEAIKRSDKVTLEKILNDGLPVNAEDKSHLSLLHYAVLVESTDIVGLLLERGADPNCEGPKDQTPLHCAAARGNRGITKLLLANGGYVRAKDRQFRTPLHLCAGNLQSLEVSYVLVEHGARIEENDLEGTRPVDLHLELREMQNRLVQSACEAFALSDLSRSRSDSGSSSSYSSNLRLAKDHSTSPSISKRVLKGGSKHRIIGINKAVDDPTVRSSRRSRKGRKSNETQAMDVSSTLRHVITGVEEKITAEAELATSKEIDRPMRLLSSASLEPYSKHKTANDKIDHDEVINSGSLHVSQNRTVVDMAVGSHQDVIDNEWSIEVSGTERELNKSKTLYQDTQHSTRDENSAFSGKQLQHDKSIVTLNSIDVENSSLGTTGTQSLSGDLDLDRTSSDQIELKTNDLNDRVSREVHNDNRTDKCLTSSEEPISNLDDINFGFVQSNGLPEGATSSDDDDDDDDDGTDGGNLVDVKQDHENKDGRTHSGSYLKLFKRDPTEDALSLLVTLSANPECHSSILESLCLPKPSSRLITIAYSSTEAEHRQQIATLIGNLFSPSRPDTKSKAVQAGLLKTVIDLLESPEPIQGTCLSILKDLLQSENDKDYVSAVTSIPIHPLLSLIEKSGVHDDISSHSSASCISKLTSKGTQSSLDSVSSVFRRLDKTTSSERRLQVRKLRGSSSCQDDIGINGSQKPLPFILKDSKKTSIDRSNLRHGSVSGPLQGISSEVSDPSYWDSTNSCDGREATQLSWVRRTDKADKLSEGTTDTSKLDPSLSMISKVKKSGRPAVVGFDLTSNTIPPSLLAKHVSLKMLSAASTNPKMQTELSKKRALQLLVQCAASSDLEITTLGVCTLANIASNIETHERFEEDNIQNDLIPLLKHKELKVRYHVARTLIYLGNFDVEDVYLYDVITSLDLLSALYAEDANSELTYVRGISLEHLVLCITKDITVLWDGSSLPPPSPSEKKSNGRNGTSKINGKYFPSEQQIINFVLTMYQTFTHPVIFMRLLLHRFHDPVHFKIFEDVEDNASDIAELDRFAGLPSVHCRLMRIWVTWLENFPNDFSKHPKILDELSELTEPMRAVGGPYEPCADKLEVLIDNVKNHRKASNGSRVKEVESQHDLLYEQCQNAIVSGALPCTEDDYVYLGGLQLFVEDICEYGPDFPLRLSTIESITPTRIKQSIYPSAASSKIMVRRIRAYYEQFCEQMPTERNAKHDYIDCCQGLVGYGCRFFKLKQKLPSKGGKKYFYTNRLFGVSSKRIAILEEKTKAPIGKWSFRDLRTWEPSEDNLSVRMIFKGTTMEFQLDNKGLFKELSNYILTCTMEINYQGLRNIDASPWSKVSEESGTWGAPAVRMYLQQMKTDSDGSFDATLGKGSPTGRERSKTFMPVCDKRPISPFSRCQSYAGKGVSKSVPAQANESSSGIKPSSGGQTSASGSSGSSGMCTVDQGLKTSYLESLVSGVRQSGKQSKQRQTSTTTFSKNGGQSFPNQGMSNLSEIPEKLPMLPDTTENDFFRYYPGKISNKILTCQCPPDAHLPNLNRQDFSAFELLQHPKELARQITLIDHELFRAMAARDIQEKLSIGIIRKITRPDDTPHTVERVAQRFNQLSNWISFCLVSERNIERRAQLFVNFIETAKQCLELRNYNAVMAIVVAALGSAPVRRLRATKELIPTECLNLFSKMEMLMDTKNNYKKYREALRTSPTPAVPYFGIYLKDLTFISDGNPDYFRGGLVNLNKRRLVYVLLDEVHRFQRKRYNFQEVTEIRHYLLSRPQTSEDQLHKMSREIEPSVHSRALDDVPGPTPLQQPIEKRMSMVTTTLLRHNTSSKIIQRRMLSVAKSPAGGTIV